jgi:hypothetical protein
VIFISLFPDCILYFHHMKYPLVIKYVLPFILWYLLMILVTITIDYILHYFNLVFIGRYLGYTGTFAILVSLIYSLKKRKIINYGSPKKLLALHEYLAWVGAVMVLVHAGIHFNALLPWLAIILLLVTVGSGLVGKYLLKRSNESLKERKSQLISGGMPIAEVEKQLLFDSLTVDAMKKWRIVHMPITYLLGILSLLHILTIFMFSK